MKFDYLICDGCGSMWRVFSKAVYKCPLCGSDEVCVMDLDSFDE